MPMWLNKFEASIGMMEWLCGLGLQLELGQWKVVCRMIDGETRYMGHDMHTHCEGGRL